MTVLQAIILGVLLVTAVAGLARATTTTTTD